MKTIVYLTLFLLSFSSCSIGKYYFSYRKGGQSLNHEVKKHNNPFTRQKNNLELIPNSDNFSLLALKDSKEITKPTSSEKKRTIPPVNLTGNKENTNQFEKPKIQSENNEETDKPDAVNQIVLASGIILASAKVLTVFSSLSFGISILVVIGSFIVGFAIFMLLLYLAWSIWGFPV